MLHGINIQLTASYRQFKHTACFNNGNTTYMFAITLHPTLFDLLQIRSKTNLL